MKVFLAEDDATTVSLLKILLEMEGHQVVTFAPKEPVLDAIRAARPDALVLDLTLPDGQDGLQILRALRQETDDALRQMKIVVCSGADRRAEVMQAGADAFLLKPYMPDDLLRELAEDARN